MDRATGPREWLNGYYCLYTALEGFGAHSRSHTAKILRLSDDLPIVVEIVDTSEKIEAFLPLIDDAIKEGLATLEKVHIRFYRRRGKPELGT